MQLATRRVSLCVAEHGNDDVRAQAMHGAQGRGIGARLDLNAADHLVEAQIARVSDAIDDMKFQSAHPRHNQIAMPLRCVTMAGRASVPTHVMQFVANAGNLEETDHLVAGLAIRIGVVGRHVI
jgi:hypothetical protein